MEPQVSAPGMSEASRVVGVITSPDKAFADIAQRPRWIVPMLLVILSSLSLIWFFNQRVGWDRFINTTIANDPRIEKLPPEQKATVLAQQRKFVPIMGWVAPVVFTPVVTAIVALILLGVFNLAMGAQFKFKNLFSIATYSGLPGVIHSLLAILVMHLKEPDEFDLQHPTAFNLGAILDPDKSAKWLQSLLGSFDLFIFWSIVLLAIGIRALDRKRSFGSCLAGVLIPWVIWVVCKTGWAAMFG